MSQTSEAPLEWIFEFLPLRVFIGSISLNFLAASAYAITSGWYIAACGQLLISLAMAGMMFAFNFSRFSAHSLQFILATGFAFAVVMAFTSLVFPGVQPPSIGYVHRTCGMGTVLWRMFLPYYCLKMRWSCCVLAFLTVVELYATRKIFFNLGIEAEITRPFFMLTFFSCFLTPAWCHFNYSMWHAIWSSKVQLEAEKESSKALLSMVCDATFWLHQHGDTILKSSKQLDALLGREAEGSQLSTHVPLTEVTRLSLALSSHGGKQTVRLLPTTILRNGSVATNVDVFIVPSQPSSSDRTRKSDTVETFESLGRLIGLRFSQNSNDFFDACEVSPRLEVSPPDGKAAALHNGKAELGTIPVGDAQYDTLYPSALRSRRSVTFDENVSHHGASSSWGSSSQSLLFRHTEWKPLKSGGVAVRNCRAYGEPITASSPYLKECVLSLLEDMLDAMNYECHACCPWHGHIDTVTSFLNDMKAWHKCEENWPPQQEMWQCRNCSAVLSLVSTEYCWMCSSKPE